MISLLEQTIGHENLIERFLHSYQKGSLPHAMLFVGPSGVGKKRTALALAQLMLCRQPQPSRACGICSSCMAISRGEETESLLLVGPDKNQIKLEEAHRILTFLNLKALRQRRVIIIDSADLLNPQAANSLLKILEEPPAETFFFLIAPSTVHVMATLRSRSQVMSFSPLTLAQLQSKSRAPEWALRASQGSFEKLGLVTDKHELESREKAISFLQVWLEQPQGYLWPDIRDFYRDRSSARSIAQHLAWLFRDVFYVQQRRLEYVLNLDQKAFLEKLAAQIPSEGLLDACQKALGLEDQLDANQDSSLVFESFWIKTREHARINS